MNEKTYSITDRNKIRQCITGGIFYCRDNAGFNASAFNKLLCKLTGKCVEIGNKNIPPNVISKPGKHMDTP